MQKIVMIIHAPPYGSERCLSGLRVALSLSARENVEIKVFLMSDATVVALPKQQDASGNTLEQMIELLIEQGGEVLLCKTCVSARGLTSLPLIQGCHIGTLEQLSEMILKADKVLTF